MSLREAPVDVVLETTAGGSRRLAEHRGKVVVLFWERRERQRDSAALKNELGAYARDPALAREVAVVAVGDVSAYDFEPARTIVRAAISAIASAFGIEILLDWRAELARPPFSLRAGRSNVMVLDREGRPVLRRSGALGAAERRSLLDAVRGLVGSAASTASPVL